MRILHVVTMDRIRSGGPMQLQRLVLQLVRRGHQVTALFGDNADYREDFRDLEKAGVDVRFMEFGGFRPDARTLRAIRGLRKLLQTESFDLIHAHKGTTLDLLFFAARGMSVPIVANRGMSQPLTRWNSKKYRMRRVKKIVAVSENVKQVLVTSGDIDPGRVQVIYGSVDTEVFRPDLDSDLRSRLNISPQVPVVGYLGNINRRKGISHLVAAFAGIKRSVPDAVMIMVGITDAGLAHYGIAIPPELDQSIHRLPFRSDVASCMAAFDVFVFSGIKAEGLTGTLREAAAMALPIVSTDVGGNAELIRHQVTGLLVPAGDDAALAAAVTELLMDPESGRQMGVRARQLVLDTMTDDIRVRQMEDLYRNVAAIDD